ncbi:MAG: citrate synthase [Thaumarchaeota archaeon]|nr:citrate synthase [Nitrososphaerota archaeon]
MIRQYEKVKVSSTIAARGLEDVIVGPSSLTLIEGERGKLSYRGYDVVDLVRYSTFEETIYLLWYGRLPTKTQLQEFASVLADNRRLPNPIVDMLKSLPKDSHPMDVLRTSISALGLFDPDRNDSSREASMRKSVRLLAKCGTIVATFDRIRNGWQPLTPNPALNYASDFIRMLQGKAPDPEIARVFDMCLVMHVDHELNASTFAARVTASTLSDVYSAVTSAIGTLKGKLHGGANEEVLEMLDSIKTPDKAPVYVKSLLANRMRVMGFGHRVYKTIDPRAVVLRELSRKLGERAGDTRWYEISRKIEEIMLAERNLKPNVDFYSASVYRMLGFPKDFSTTIFACSRVTGWTAHILEQYDNNRLMRPRAEYIGSREMTYIPIDQRNII